MSRYHQVNSDPVFIILFVTEYLLAGADRHHYGAAPWHHPQPDVLQQGVAQPSQAWPSPLFLFLEKYTKLYENLAGYLDV